MIDLRALITGASGFVGTYMTRSFLDADVEVLGISRSQSCLNGVSSEDYKCDILEKDKLKRIMKSFQPDLIVHLASPAYIPHSLREPQKTYDIIFQGTLNVLESMRDLNINPKLLYVSSADVYGHSGNRILTEEQPFDPINPYSSAKACAELLCRQFYHCYGTDVIIARPFNHTGPGQSSRFVCSEFAYQVAVMNDNQKKILYTGYIDVERDFLDVRDIANAYMQLLQNGLSGQVYNVCSGNGVSIRSIIQILFEQAGIPQYEIIQDKSKLRKDDVPFRVGDNRRLLDIVSWEPQYKLEQTIADLFRYWKEKLYVKK